MLRRRKDRFFGRTLLRTNILLVSLFLVLGLLIVMFPFTYQLTRRLLRDSQTNSAKQILEQTNKSVEFYLASMLEAAEYVASKPSAQTFMAGGTAARSDLEEHLQVIAGTRADFFHLVLLREDGQLAASRTDLSLNPQRDYKEEDWYRRAVEAKGVAIFTSSRVENLFLGEYPWVITMAKAMYSGERLTGILLVDLKYERIESIFKATRQDDNRAYFFLVGSDGRIVYHPQQQLIYSGIKSEALDEVSVAGTDIETIVVGDKLYIAERSELTDWVTVSVINEATLVAFPAEWIWAYAALGLFFVGLASLLSWLAAKRLTRPLFSLQQSMKRFEEGDLDTVADTRATSEIADLGDSFNLMTSRIKDLIAESVAAEEQKRQSEMLALQAQIRPHFLYNTLESIIWMSEIGENEKVVEMTSALSKLLRAQIAGGAEVIRLEEEINYTRHYLTIQSLRYGDRLRYEVEIEPGLEDTGVLRLVLQPLVENALYHGTRHSRRNGLIRIAAKSDGDLLVIEVSDNGAGFKNAANWRQREPGEEGGIGLKNVEDRIVLFFGPEYKLEIETRDRKGLADDEMTTVIRIRHPKVTL